MRNTSIIAKEIVELSAIRSAYNHYLASHRALTDVENATTVRANKSVISKSLRSLYAMLEQQKKGIGQSKQNVPAAEYNYSDAEAGAILHFNRDRRFTITE